jgi:menaquinone-9 beta-reductase
VVHVHDAIVVGAGPGGSAAAHFLAARGLDALLLDRADFPRDKTCGDGLTPRALRVLDNMRILDEVAAAGCPVAAYEVVAPNGRSTRATIPNAGALVVPRFILDEMILRRAIQSGATFRPKVTITRLEASQNGVDAHTASGDIVHGRVAVIATGAATAVLKQSGILARQPRSMLAARAYFESERGIAPVFQLSFRAAPMPGYGWVFPVEDKRANIGVGYLPHRASPPTAVAFQRFVDSLAGVRQLSPFKGYPIRVDFLHAPTFGQRTLLIGEAAGLVNPLTGEGIDYALESGQIAAEHVVRGLTSGVYEVWHTDYDRLLRARFQKIFRFSEWIRDWYCKPALLNLLVPMANRRPELRQLLANIVLGEREPRGYGPVTMAARLAVYLARHRGGGSLRND